MSYNAVYNLANADVIVSLDSDFLCHGSAGLRYSRDFSDRRRISSAETPAEQKAVLENRPKEDEPEGHGPGSRTPAQGTPANLNLNRLYVFEGTPSLTGSVADHRFRVKTSEVAAVASALAGAVGAGGAAGVGSVPPSVAGAIAAVAKDLQAHRGRCVVIAGPYQPPAVHAAAHAMNSALGAVGSTVTYSAPVDINPVNGAESLRQLVADMNGGRVQTLLMLGGNPVYDAPADFGFIEALKKVKMRMHLTLFANETSRNCHWAVPEAHYLESWGDARSHDGTVTIIQPLIAPLYGGRTPVEILAVLNGKADAEPRTVVQDYWRAQPGTTDFDAWWQRSLNDGVVATAAALPTATPDFGGAPAPPPPQGAMEIVFRPDHGLFDGRFANNGWLQEMPKPLTRMTWDNAALLSPRTAQRLNVENGSLIEISSGANKVTAPVWVLPGHADESVTVTLGLRTELCGPRWKRRRLQRVPSAPVGQLWIGAGDVRKTAGSYEFAVLQSTQTMEA